MLKISDDYSEYIQQLFPDFFINKEVKQITFQVTDACQLRCTYCYQINKQTHSMSFQTAKRMIDYIFDNKDDPDFFFSETKTGGIIVEFFGGEPLLEAKLMMRIADYFEEKLLQYPDSQWNLFHHYSISTNGIAYFNADVQKFIKKYKTKCSVGVTVDGCKELHDKCRVFPDGSPSYDLAIKAALSELYNSIDASTKITVSPENINYVFDGIKNMVELGFRDIHINGVFEDCWDIKDAQNLYKQLKLVADWVVHNDLQNKVYVRFFDSNYYHNDSGTDKNYCGSTYNMLALDYKGDIYPCVRFMESSLGDSVEPYIIGNLDKGIGIEKLHKQRLNCLACITKKSQSEPKCLECPIESGCAWCTAYNYQVFNTPNKRAIFICGIHRAAALASKYFYKLCNDKESYSKIMITKEMSLDIISEEEWNFLADF